jgi:multicomponent K+:H+ antiporter subunit A
MSAVALIAGVSLYFGLQRTINLHSVSRLPGSGKHMFEAALGALEMAGRQVVAWSPAQSLPRSLAWIVAGAFLATAWPLAIFGFGAPHDARSPIDMQGGHAVLGLLAWVLAVGGALGATVCYRHRLIALMLLGVAGLAVSLAFVLLSAPDLALTQLLVEIVTIVLIMVVLHYLPPTSPPDPERARRWRDAGLAIVAGLGITWIVHAILTRPFAPISPFFLERALTEGGGTNVVNVILVDFRGYDTLGEVTVLGIAGLLVYALLHNLRLELESRPVLPASTWNPLLVREVTRTLVPLAALVAIFLFLRGHNQPGGGFIAGLTFACALIAARIGGGGRPVPSPEALPQAPWIAGGLLLAGLTGLGSLGLGYPFLTSTSGHPVLPWLGEIPLASAALFDLGVFVTVVAATLLATLSPGLLPAGRIGGDPR